MPAFLKNSSQIDMPTEKQFSEALRVAVDESRRLGHPRNRFDTMFS